MNGNDKGTIWTDDAFASETFYPGVLFKEKGQSVEFKNFVDNQNPVMYVPWIN